jgi:hypothetical protein
MPPHRKLRRALNLPHSNIRRTRSIHRKPAGSLGRGIRGGSPSIVCLGPEWLARGPSRYEAHAIAGRAMVTLLGAISTGQRASAMTALETL